MKVSKVVPLVVVLTTGLFLAGALWAQSDTTEKLSDFFKKKNDGQPTSHGEQSGSFNEEKIPESSPPLQPAPPPQPQPQPQRVYQQPPAGGRSYTTSQIREEVRRLARQLNFPREKVVDLIANFDRASFNDWYKKQMRTRAIKGVFVYEAGKGGFVVTFMEGKGLVTFLNGPQRAPIYMKSWSVGAQIGGEAIWGLGLVVDLMKTSHFEGDYQGKMQSATAADVTTYNWVVMRHARYPHDIFLLQSGRGLSAGVSAERLTITPMW